MAGRLSKRKIAINELLQQPLGARFTARELAERTGVSISTAARAIADVTRSKQSEITSQDFADALTGVREWSTPMRASRPSAATFRMNMSLQSEAESRSYANNQYPARLIQSFMKAQREGLLFETEIDGIKMGETQQWIAEMRAAKGDPLQMRKAASRLEARLTEVGAYSSRVGPQAAKAQNIRQKEARRQVQYETSRIQALQEFEGIYRKTVGQENVQWRNINGRPVLVVKQGDRESIADVNPDRRLGGVGGAIINGLQYHPLLEGDTEKMSPTSLRAQQQMIGQLFSNPKLSPYAAAQASNIRTSWHTRGGGDAFSMHLNATWSLDPGREEQPRGIYQREDRHTGISMRLLGQLPGNAPDSLGGLSTLGDKTIKRTRQTGASQQNVYTPQGIAVPREEGIGGVTGYGTNQLLVFSNLAGALPAALINERTSRNLQLGNDRDWRFSVPSDQYTTEDRANLMNLIGKSTQRRISIGGVMHQLGGSHTAVDISGFDDSVTYYDGQQQKPMTTITLRGVERGGGGQKIWGGNKNALLEANLSGMNAINALGESVDLSAYDVVTTMSGNALAVMERAAAAQPFQYLSEGFDRLRATRGAEFSATFEPLINEANELDREALENPQNRLLRQQFFGEFFQNILLPEKGMNIRFSNVMSQEHIEAMTNQRIEDILANPQSETLRALGIENVEQSAAGMYNVSVAAKALPTRLLEDFTRVPGSRQSRLTPALRQAMENLSDPAVQETLSIVGQSARRTATDVVRAQALNEGLNVSPYGRSVDLSQVSLEQSTRYANVLSQQMSKMGITEINESSAHLVSQAQIAALKEAFGADVSFYDPATEKHKALYTPTIGAVESSRGISDTGQDFGLSARVGDYVSSRVLSSTRSMVEGAEEKLRAAISAAATSSETRKALLGAGRDPNVTMSMAVPLAALRNNEIAMSSSDAYRAIKRAAQERGLWSGKYAAALKENIQSGNMMGYSIGLARHPHAPGDQAIVANIITQAELNRRYGRFAPKIRSTEIGVSPTMMSAFGGDFDADQLASFVLMGKYGDRAGVTPSREILRRAQLNPAGELQSLQKDKYRNISKQLNIRTTLSSEDIRAQSQQSMRSKLRMGIMFNLARGGAGTDTWYKMGKGLYQKALDLSGMSIGGDLIDEMLSSSYRSGQRRVGKDRDGKPVFGTSLHGLRAGTRISDQAMIQGAWGRSIYRALSLTDEIDPEDALSLLTPSGVTLGDEQRQSVLSKIDAMRNQYKASVSGADPDTTAPSEIRANALKSIEQNVYTGYEELMGIVRSQLGNTRTITYQDYERDEYGMPVERDGKRNIVTRSETNQQYFNIQDTDAPAAYLLGRIARKDLRNRGLAANIPGLNRSVQDLMNRTGRAVANIDAQGSIRPQSVEDVLVAMQGSDLQGAGRQTLAEFGLTNLSGSQLRAREVALAAQGAGATITPSRSLISRLRQSMRPSTSMQEFIQSVDAHMAQVSAGGGSNLGGGGTGDGGDSGSGGLGAGGGFGGGGGGTGGGTINVVASPPPPSPIRMPDIAVAQKAISTLSTVGLPQEYGATVTEQIQSLLSRVRGGQTLNKMETQYAKSIVTAYEKATGLLRRTSSEKVSGDPRAISQIQTLLGKSESGGLKFDNLEAIRALFGDLGHISSSKDAIDFFRAAGAGEANIGISKQTGAISTTTAPKRALMPMLRESDFSTIQSASAIISNQSAEQLAALSEKITGGGSLSSQEARFVQQQIGAMRKVRDISGRVEGTMQRGNETQRAEASLVQDILSNKSESINALNSMLYKTGEGGIEYSESASNLMQTASRTLAEPTLRTRGISAELDALNQDFEKMSKIMRDAGKSSDELTKAQVRFITETGASVTKMREIQEQVSQLGEDQIEALPQGSIERYVAEKTKTGELDKSLEKWEKYLSRPTGKDGQGKSLYDLAIQQSRETTDAYRNMDYDDMLRPFLDRSASGRRRRETELAAGVYGDGLKRAAWQGWGNAVGGTAALTRQYWELRQLNSIVSDPFSNAHAVFQQNRAAELRSAASMTTMGELTNTDTYANIRRSPVQQERTQLALGRGYSDVWSPLLGRAMGLAENRTIGQIGSIVGPALAAGFVGNKYSPNLGFLAAGATALTGLVSGISGRRGDFEERARYQRQLGDQNFLTQVTGDLIGWAESGMSAWLGDETAAREIEEAYGYKAHRPQSIFEYVATISQANSPLMQAGWANATLTGYNIGLSKLKSGDVSGALQYGQARTYIEKKEGLKTTYGLKYDPNMTNRIGRWVGESGGSAIDFQYTYGAINQLYEDFDSEYAKLASTGFRADIGFLEDEKRRQFFYEALSTFAPGEAYKQSPDYVAKQGELGLAGLSLQQYGQAFAPGASMGTAAYAGVIKQVMGTDLRTLKIMSPYLAQRQEANANIMLSGGEFNMFRAFTDVIGQYGGRADVLARESALYDQFAGLTGQLDFEDAGAWYRYGARNLLDKPRDFMAMMQRSDIYAEMTQTTASAGYAAPGETSLDVLSGIQANASADLVGQVNQYMSRFGLDMRTPKLANALTVQTAAGINYEQMAQAMSALGGENELDTRRQSEIRTETIEKLTSVLERFDRDNEELRVSDVEEYNRRRRDLIDTTNQTIQEASYAGQGAQIARQFGLTVPAASAFAGLNQEQIQLMLSRISSQGQRNLADVGALTGSDAVIEQAIRGGNFGQANRLAQQQEQVFGLQQQYARYGNQSALAILDRMSLMDGAEFSQAMGVLSGDPLATSRYVSQRRISSANSFMYTMQTGQFGGRVGMPALYDEDMRAAGLAPVINELSALDASQGGFASRYAGVAGIDTTYMNTLQAQTMSREIEFTQFERQRAMQSNDLQRRRALTTGTGSITAGLTSGGAIGEIGVEAGIDKSVDTITKKTIGQLLATVKGGAWGLEDRGTLLQREKQDYSIALQERQQARERARLGENGWEEAQWQERYWFNRGRTMVQLAWSQQDIFRQQYQQTRQMSWQREDFAFNRNQQQIGFAWEMEDFDRNIRYARGREKRDLQRQQERAVIQNSMAVGRQNVEEVRMNETQGWTKEQMKIDAERFEQNKKWTIEQMDMELRHHMQQRKNQLEEFQERQKQFEKEKSWLAEERVLEDQGRALKRAEFLITQKEQEHLLQISQQEEAILRALGERVNLIAARNEQAKVTLDYYAKTGELLPQIVAGMNGFVNSIVNLGGILGTIGSIINVIRGIGGNSSGAPTTTAKTKLNRQGLGFASGGYTGDGSPDQIAGYVHRREYVVPENGALVMRDTGNSDRMERLTEQMIDILRQIAENGRGGNINITVSGNSKEDGVKAALSMYDKAFA